MGARFEKMFDFNTPGAKAITTTLGDRDEL